MFQPAQFSTLPAELRLKIYYHALPFPQIIHIKNYHTDPWNSMIRGFSSPSHPPRSPPSSLSLSQDSNPSPTQRAKQSPLLSLNRESRHAYLQHHSPICADNASGTIYLNPRADTLLLDLSWLTYQLSHPFMDLLAPSAVLREVRYLAIDFLTKEGGGLGYLLLRNPLVLFELFSRFEGLREVVFLLGRVVNVRAEGGEEVGKEGDGGKEEGDRVEGLEWEEVPDGGQMGNLKERILIRVKWAFGQCKGHKLEKLPRIRVLVAKGGDIKGCCCGWGGIGP